MGLMVRAVYTGGWMDVEPGLILIRPDRLTRRLTSVDVISYRSPAVQVTTTRIPIIPPFGNTSLNLSQSNTMCVATVSRWSRNELLAALTAAGFKLEHHTTWLTHPYR